MKVALVCIAKDEDNYIQEWIDYHLKLGFDDIFIYENDWSCNVTHPQVHKVEFNGQSQQLPAYNHFIDTKSKDYDWVAFFDVDEFLVLKTHLSVKSFLMDYDRYNALAINWVIFSDSGLEKVADGSYDVVDRFIKRRPGVEKHIKTILHTKAINNIKNYTKFIDDPHHTNLNWCDTSHKIGNGPYNFNGVENIAQLNHYFSKTREEFIEKINRGRSDNVDEKYRRSMSEYIEYNSNDVDDYSAYNFKHGTNRLPHFYQNIDGFSAFPDQGELLLRILTEVPENGLKIAEIGVYKGRMTAMWNVILRNQDKKYEYIAIDHFKGSIEHDNTVDYYAETLSNLSLITDSINIINMASIDAATTYPDGYFDIVYIDASHEYEPVKADICAWYPKVKPGGIICGDDYVDGWPGVIQAVDEYFPKINRVGGQQWWVKKECES